MATRKLPKGATTKRPSSRGYASNASKIASLVPPEKVPVNNPSTMSSSRDSQNQAFKAAKTGVSETYKLDAKGNKIPVSEEEFKKAAQKFVNAERKIPKGTSLNQVKAAKLAGKEKAISDIAKVASKGLDNLSAAERKMAREGIAPPRAPATPPTSKPAAPAPVAAPKVATTTAAPKMTRAERSAANKAKHVGVRAAEEKKWAEQKAAKKSGATKAPAKVKAAPAKAAPAKTVATPAAKKPVAAKPVKAAPTRKAKPQAAKPAKPQTAKPKAAKAAPASSAAAPATAAPKAGILSKLKGITKNVFSLKAAGAEIGGNFAADAIRGDGKSSARNIVATVVDDSTTGYAVGRGYGAVAGAAVGLVRGASAEGKRTGKAPLALPTTPRHGGTFGGKQPATGGSVGPRTRGGARGVSRTSGTATAAAARPATTAKQGLSAFGSAFKQARQARLSGQAGDTFQYGGKTYTSYQKGEQSKASAPKAVASETPKPTARAAWNASKATDMGTIEISKPAQNNQMQQSISAMQLEEQFKKRKGPR
jgi:hypothetical protein